jgi:hypothetical protein
MTNPATTHAGQLARRACTAPAIRARQCPLCRTPAGEPYQPKPEGDHLARYLDAHTAAQITKAYMAAVLGELVVIDVCSTVIPVPREPAQELTVAERARRGACKAAALAKLEQLLQAGHTLSYAPDPVWDGYWADLRDGAGHLAETGSGATKTEALTDLARRLGGAR